MRLIDADAFEVFFLNVPDDAHPESYVRGVESVLDAVEEAPTVNRWIPCSERLPKPFEHCLWTTTDGRVVYHHCDGLFSNYTAWMPLP